MDIKPHINRHEHASKCVLNMKKKIKKIKQKQFLSGD